MAHLLTSSEERRELSETALQAPRYSRNWLRLMAVYHSTKLIPSQRNHDLENFGMACSEVSACLQRFTSMVT